MFLMFMMFMNSKNQMKKKGEEIRVSLQKLKCAKTDSPTCKWYWLTHPQVNLQSITSWKISERHAFHMQMTMRIHLSLNL